MAATLPQTPAAAPLHRLAEVRPRMAKVLNPVEIPSRAPAGAALRRAMNAVSAGRFWPPPIADTEGHFLKPYLFDRATVQAFLEGKLPRPRRVRLVTTRRRLAAATSRRSA